MVLQNKPSYGTHHLTSDCLLESLSWCDIFSCRSISTEYVLQSGFKSMKLLNSHLIWHSFTVATKRPNNLSRHFYLWINNCCPLSLLRCPHLHLPGGAYCKVLDVCRNRVHLFTTLNLSPITVEGAEYHLFREASKQHWESMKSHYQKVCIFYKFIVLCSFFLYIFWYVQVFKLRAWKITLSCRLQQLFQMARRNMLPILQTR